jgi:hypothetical protein
VIVPETWNEVLPAAPPSVRVMVEASPLGPTCRWTPVILTAAAAVTVMVYVTV